MPAKIEPSTLSPHGTRRQFLQSQALDAAFQELEQDFAKFQGISMTTGTPTIIGTLPRFPPEPYLVVTTLVETPDGRLVPQLPQR